VSFLCRVDFEERQDVLGNILDHLRLELGMLEVRDILSLDHLIFLHKENKGYTKS
jgi:hypothetical protein